MLGSSVLDMSAETTHESIIIDCNRCLVRSPAACGDCVVSVFLGPGEADLELDHDEQAALEMFADSGLVPPLRLVTSVKTRSPHADAS